MLHRLSDKQFILALTSGNVDDRKPVKELLDRQSGNFYGDKGYVCKALALELRAHGVVLITKLKKNLKNQLMKYSDKQLLPKRAVIESSSSLPTFG